MKHRFAATFVGITVLATSLAFAQSKETPRQATKAPPPASAKDHGAAPKMELPPGMTEEDMKACMAAATPGPMHAFLAESAGVWNGACTSWMGPDSPPSKSECTLTFTPMMDGRFLRCEMAGEMPGMGPFSGFSVIGFDNVSEKFQSTWLDNCSTGMMVGTGELSSDRSTLSWSFTGNCPLTKKPVAFREIERFTGKDSRMLEMFATDPKSGKEFKLMELALKRNPAATPVTLAH